MNDSLLIESLRKQIQFITFDANLYDLGIITDNPYQKNCSEKRKKLNAEIAKLGGVVKPLPFQKPTQAIPETSRQMGMFDEAS